jgi:predicted nucleic acid-binding protein
MRRAAVIDSSSLINLTHLNLAHKLSLYFSVIYVPRRVHMEVNRKSKFRYRLNKLYQTGFFERCRCADETRVQLLLPELDGGEAEGLVQAQEKGARFFIADEIRGREIGERMDLIPVGTVRLIARLHLEQQAEDTTSLVRKLRRQLNFRVGDDVVERAIAIAHEPI